MINAFLSSCHSRSMIVRRDRLGLKKKAKGLSRPFSSPFQSWLMRRKIGKENVPEEKRWSTQLIQLRMRDKESKRRENISSTSNKFFRQTLY